MDCPATSVSPGLSFVQKKPQLFPIRISLNIGEYHPQIPQFYGARVESARLQVPGLAVPDMQISRSAFAEKDIPPIKSRFQLDAMPMTSEKLVGVMAVPPKPLCTST
jgi:hypothetical protein